MHAVLSLALLLAAADTPMRLAPGDKAADFSLAATNGKTVKLADYLGKKTVVLAFYPKAFTGGCTKEMAGLRDVHTQFADPDAQVLGSPWTTSRRRPSSRRA